MFVTYGVSGPVEGEEELAVNIIAIISDGEL